MPRDSDRLAAESFAVEPRRFVIGTALPLFADSESNEGFLVRGGLSVMLGHRDTREEQSDFAKDHRRQSLGGRMLV